MRATKPLISPDAFGTQAVFYTATRRLCDRWVSRMCVRSGGRFLRGRGRGRMRGGGANSGASSKPKHKAKPRAQILKQGRG